LLFQFLEDPVAVLNMQHLYGVETIQQLSGFHGVEPLESQVR
jgi:hypothetical protein